MINYYRRSLKDEKLKELSDFKSGCWINVVNPSEKEINFLEFEFELNRQNILSGIDKNEVSRTEKEDDKVYILLKVITINKKDLETLLIIVSSNYILTLTMNNQFFIDQIIDNKIKFITTQMEKSLLDLLALINQSFEKTTLDIVRNVKKEKDSIDEMSDKIINSLLMQEDLLNKFVLAYHQSNLVYTRIIRYIKFSEDDKELLEDLIIEAQQGYELCRLSLKNISNIRSYSDILLSHKLNKVINILTIFTIIISVPSAISGLYGMNVVLPFQQNPNMFYYIFAFIFAIWVAFILILKKKKIL